MSEVDHPDATLSCDFMQNDPVSSSDVWNENSDPSIPAEGMAALHGISEKTKGYNIGEEEQLQCFPLSTESFPDMKEAPTSISQDV